METQFTKTRQMLERAQTLKVGCKTLDFFDAVTHDDVPLLADLDNVLEVVSEGVQCPHACIFQHECQNFAGKDVNVVSVRVHSQMMVGGSK